MDLENKRIKTYKVRTTYVRADGTIKTYESDRKYLVTQEHRGRPSAPAPTPEQ